MQVAILCCKHPHEIVAVISIEISGTSVYIRALHTGVHHAVQTEYSYILFAYICDPS